MYIILLCRIELLDGTHYKLGMMVLKKNHITTFANLARTYMKVYIESSNVWDISYYRNTVQQ